MDNVVNTPLEWIGAALFLFAWIIGLLSWLYMVVETLWIWRRNPRACRHGPVVLRFVDADLPVEVMSSLRDTIETPTGTVAPFSVDRLVFAPRIGSLFNPIAGLRMLFFYSGVVSWKADGANVAIRIPLGIATFASALIVLWTVFAIFLAPSAECYVNGERFPPGSSECTFFGLIPIAAVVLAAIAVVAIRARARRLFAEIKEHVLKGQFPRSPAD